MQASLQSTNPSKYPVSDKVKRMSSARPLTAKKDSLPSNSNTDDKSQPVVGPKFSGNAPMRKIVPEQFYKPPNASLTPSQSQPVGMEKNRDKFERYQSPMIKLNQSSNNGSAKQVQDAISTNMGMFSSSIEQSSTSASRLMQSQTQINTSIKIATKGSKQMNQFRYGPVRAVQQTMPHSFSSGIANLQKHVISQQKTLGEGKGQTKNNLLSESF